MSDDAYQELLHAWRMLVAEMDAFFETHRDLSMAQDFADRLFERLIEPLQCKHGVELSRKAADQAFLAFFGSLATKPPIEAPDKAHRRPRLVSRSPTKA